jgi:hypothetical protein
MSEGFLGIADTFLLFFKLCERYKLGPEKEKERIELLRKLVAHNRAKYLRNPADMMAGKRILKIERKKNG